MTGTGHKGAILLTGGAGFIGSNLLERLLDSGIHVVCVDNFNGYYDPLIKRRNIAQYINKTSLFVEEGDIRDITYLRKVLTKHPIQKIIHLAAQPGVRYSLSEPFAYIENNINGTINMLEVAREADVESFVFASSSSVYGDSKQLPFSEDGEVHPVSPYGVTKLSAEQFCYAYHELYGIPITVLRLFSVYGPRQRPDMAIYKFLKAILEEEELTMYGAGDTSRDYTYVTDIAEGMVRASEASFDWEIINLGDSNAVMLRDLVLILENCVGKKAQIRSLPEQPGDPKTTCASVEKAATLLGYYPGVSIEEGIALYVKWYLEEILYT